MNERQIVMQKLKEKEIEDFVLHTLGKLSCSHVRMQRTPLGERIIVYTTKPGVIVGRKGMNIRLLTETLKEKFKFENPQIEVEEIRDPDLDAASIAKRIASLIKKFGQRRFKAIAYKVIEDSLRAGAVGIEIVISGRGLPSERAKQWRFKKGYLKKSGEVSVTDVDKAFESCDLISGTVGVGVSVLRSDVRLPDEVREKGKEKIEEEK